MAIINKKRIHALEYICLNKDYIKDINNKVVQIKWKYNIQLDLLRPYTVTGNTVLLTLDLIIFDEIIPDLYVLKIGHNNYKIVDLPVQIDKVIIENKTTILYMSCQYTQNL